MRSIVALTSIKRSGRNPCPIASEAHSVDDNTSKANSLEVPSGRRTQSRDHCLMNDTVINIQIASVVSIYQLGIYIGYNSLDSLDDVEEIDCVEPIVRKVQKGRLAGTESFCSLHGTVPPFCDCLRRIVAGRHAVRNEYNMDPSPESM